MLNAAQAMPEGGSLTVVSKQVQNSYPKSGGSEDDLHIAIEFMDTGYGIPRENLKGYLIPFLQLKVRVLDLVFLWPIR